MAKPRLRLQALGELTLRRRSWRVSIHGAALVGLGLAFVVLELGTAALVPVGVPAVALAEVITRATLAQREPAWRREVSQKYGVPPDKIGR